jgi:transcriptional regulator
VSPRWFKVTRTVSTWNYLSVQAHGELRLLDETQTLAVLEQTIARMEQLAHRDPQNSAWSLTETDPELQQRLRGKVAGFELKVYRLEGVKRLNQDKHITDILSIMAGLGESPQPGAAAVLQAMASMLEQVVPGEGS